MRSFVPGLLLLMMLMAADVRAVSCGTVAAPMACTITVGGTVTYTFTGFTLPQSNASGGGTAFGAADINIDVSSGGGLAAVLTFSKNSANPGVVFFVNAGQTSNFIVSYSATISPAGLGIIAYGPLFAVDLNPASNTGNALGAVQFSIPGAPVCQAIIGIAGSHKDCTIPAGQPLAISAGSIVSMTGNSGNASMLGFTNRFDATFAYRPLDIDGNGSYDALTDGLMLLRYLFNLRGPGLIANAIGTGATRTTAAQIEQYIQLLIP
ncbi:MAG: hypothetical protein IPI73_00445 [Betaproteobacteria bacterium]|nr:hypothetical protein [Betaproteobacteria bacterium]